MVEFAVTDTGIGIAAEHLPALFSDFVQIDTRIQKRLRGTGLGCRWRRNSAELLGGRVAVTSELGKGSRFSVFIPSRYRRRRKPGERHEHRIRILAVDDNAAALYATSRVLRSAGYEVIEATTGAAAAARQPRKPIWWCWTSICRTSTVSRCAGACGRESGYRATAGAASVGHFHHMRRFCAGIRGGRRQLSDPAGRSRRC